LIDSYTHGLMKWDELKTTYGEKGEVFNLEFYRPLLEYARKHNIRVMGLSPPRNHLLKILNEGEPALTRMPYTLSKDHLKFWKLNHYENLPYILSSDPSFEWLKTKNPQNVLLMEAYKNMVMTQKMYNVLKTAPKERLYEGPPVIVSITNSVHVTFLNTMPMQLNKYIPELRYRVVDVLAGLSENEITYKILQPKTIPDYLVNVI
ncbi:MAG: ChaN family lipoprotein, partial [Desulfurococcales archaeon]|nr:ChaN family lipoprotein [Desulfurococcales archaeon]